MGIRVSTYQNNGEELKEINDRACFGFLSSGGNYDLTHIGWLPFRGNQISTSFQHLDEESTSSSQKFMQEINDIIEEVPMYEGFEIINPNNHLDQFEIKAPTTLPADQLILNFFFLRNLSHYPTVGKTYAWLAKNTNLNRAARLAISNIFVRKQTLASFENENQRWGRISGQLEQSPIQIRTFGINSFRAFINQDESFAPWTQPTFVQAGKYKRDNQYLDNENILTCTSSNLINTIGETDIRRIMASSLSLELDNPLHSRLTGTWAGTDYDMVSILSELIEEEIEVSPHLTEEFRLASMTDAERAAELINNPLDSKGFFKCGVRVRLCPDAPYAHSPFNPTASIGYIISRKEEIIAGATSATVNVGNNPYVYEVRWDETSMINDYCHTDLVTF